MKKRILALALVIVSLVTVLTGCAYRYDKKDMSEYVTADYTALEALLKSIEIKGADFGEYVKGSTARDDKVLEKIDETLAGKIATGDAKVDGSYGFRQKIYYAFYCKTADGKYFEIKNMDDTKLASLLSNPEYNAGAATEELALDSALLKEIFKAINGFVVMGLLVTIFLGAPAVLAMTPAGDFVKNVLEEMEKKKAQKKEN